MYVPTLSEMWGYVHLNWIIPMQLWAQSQEGRTVAMWLCLIIFVAGLLAFTGMFSRIRWPFHKRRAEKAMRKEKRREILTNLVAEGWSDHLFNLYMAGVFTLKEYKGWNRKLASSLQVKSLYPKKEETFKSKEDLRLHLEVTLAALDAWKKPNIPGPKPGEKDTTGKPKGMNRLLSKIGRTA